MIHITKLGDTYQIHITHDTLKTLDHTLPLYEALKYIASMYMAYSLQIAKMSMDTYNQMLYTYGRIGLENALK